MQDIDQHWSAWYDQNKDFVLITAQSISEFLEKTDQSLPKTCLDIGCGTGQLTRELYHRSYACVGIDASSSAIRIAKSLTTRDGLTYLRLDVEEGDFSTLPGRPYSLITCKLVYAFIKDKPKFLANVKSVLATDGTFAIITPLTADVPPEKSGIAVDLDVTMSELKAVFNKVDSYPGFGDTTFICQA